MPSEGASGGVHSGYGDPCVGHATLVPSTAGAPDRLSAADSSTQRAATRPTSGAERLNSASRLEGIRQSHRAEGISQQASELILAGWSKGTQHTSQGGVSGLAGVLQGKLIPFQEMSSTS